MNLKEKVHAAFGTRPQPPTSATQVRTDGWDQPIPFGHYDAPAFPKEAFPFGLACLRDYCEAVAESLQVPVDAVAMLSLSVGSAALAKRIEVVVQDDWVEPVNLYVVVAMESGERKSATFRLVTAPLTEYEMRENERRAPLIEQYKAEISLLATEFKHAQTKAAKAEKPEERQAARDRAKALAEQIRSTKPVLPLQLLADDATPEAVGQLLHDQQGRIALMSPEGDLFDLMAGRYSDGVGRLGVYLKGHAGDDYRLNRIGRASEYVRKPAITMGLAVQPDVLRGLTEKPGFRGRGLLARFAYCMPSSRVGYRALGPPSIPAQNIEAYNRMINAGVTLPILTDRNNHEVSRPLTLMPDAKRELDVFRDVIEKDLRPGGELHGLRDWGSKLSGAVCRMAGVMHGLMHAGSVDLCMPIDCVTMAGAVSIGKYLIAHAKAAFCEMGANPATAIARRIIGWAISSEASEFSRRDAFNACRGVVARVDELKAPLELLCDHNQIRELSDGTPRRPGRPNSPRYKVNPELHTQNPQNSR